MRTGIWLGLALVLQGVSTAAAQTYEPPRTLEGHPDLHGVWGNGFFTTLERPPGVNDLVVNDDGAKAIAKVALAQTPSVVDPDANFIGDFTLAKVKGEWRTSLIVAPADGKLPLTEAGAKAVKRALGQWETSYDNPEERDNWERCLIGGGQAPTRPEHGFTPMQIVQTRDAIVMMMEDVGGLRIIDMTGRLKPPAAVVSHEGYSQGHWDGDTLVVETINMRADDLYRPSVDTTMIVGPKSRVIERFTRVSDSELVEQFTVEDPAYYSKPWLAEFSHTRSEKPTYEYACHESNYSLTNILTAARLGRQNLPPSSKTAPAKARSKGKPKKP